MPSSCSPPLRGRGFAARDLAHEAGRPVERYGFEEGSGTAYFRVHEGRDIEHAAEVRGLISELASDEDADRLVAAAESAYEANWRLLDGI